MVRSFQRNSIKNVPVQFCLIWMPIINSTEYMQHKFPIPESEKYSCHIAINSPIIVSYYTYKWEMDSKIGLLCKTGTYEFYKCFAAGPPRMKFGEKWKEMPYVYKTSDKEIRLRGQFVLPMPNECVDQSFCSRDNKCFGELIIGKSWRLIRDLDKPLCIVCYTIIQCGFMSIMITAKRNNIIFPRDIRILLLKNLIEYVY